MKRGATFFAPCSLRRNGRTKTRNVTKLDTGFPGRPMKKESWSEPNASGRPGFIAMRHMRSLPSASTAGFT